MEVLTIPRADDFHVHLRQGDLLDSVAPLVAAGGVGRCLAMPNTRPPITTLAQALAYRDTLAAAAPGVTFLLALYLSNTLTAGDLAAAARSGVVVGVKCYPRGVTTNSGCGVEDLMAYDAVFEAMQAAGLVLLIHGEVPSSAALGIDVFNAESRFLPELERLHTAFPTLRIVLEHVSSREAVDCVKALGPTVAATVTAHHLDLTADDWAANVHNFCKPVAKTAADRDALRQIVCEGHPRFFLGSDSAPHLRTAKAAAAGCAGVFTSARLLPYLADCFDRLGCLGRLADFSSCFGCTFYGLPAGAGTVTLERIATPVPERFGEVVPFRAGQTLQWRCRP
jgi:dihydroorotase